MNYKNEIRNCECCEASYTTGKEYTEYWCEVSQMDNGKIKPPKGLCPFCNPRMTKEQGEEDWYLAGKLCHLK